MRPIHEVGPPPIMASRSGRGRAFGSVTGSASSDRAEVDRTRADDPGFRRRRQGGETGDECNRDEEQPEDNHADREWHGRTNIRGLDARLSMVAAMLARGGAAVADQNRGERKG